MAKILVADDDSEVREFIKFTLKKEGHEIITASDGRETLKKIYEYKPDLVVLDVMMPIMDGYHICKVIREDPKYAPVPKVIIATARKDELDKKLSGIAGADAFISKPFKPEELVSEIKKVLSS